MSRREAELEGLDVLCPSVGTWRPVAALGAPLAPGMLLGTLWRDGCPLQIVAPTGVAGVVTDPAPAGAWLAYGEPLFRCGEGTLGAAVPVQKVQAGGPEGCVALEAETDGTVFLRPSPDAPLYAPVGAQVVAASTVALVEVMKTFTPVRAPVAGEVVRVDVTDGGSVQAGKAMVWIRPA